VSDGSSFVLGVDLDGVCGDHTEAFRRVVAAELRVDPATLGPQTRWDYADWGLDEEAFLGLHRRAVLEHRMFRTMPVIAGTADTLWRLSDAGVWIRIITHRLYANWGHAVAVADTVAWLDEAGIPYRDLCFLGRKPQVEADLYVDDAPHNVLELRSAGTDVVVFDQPYNRDLAGPRARSWSEVEHLVRQAMVARGRPVQEQFPDLDDASARLGRVVGRRDPDPGGAPGTMDDIGEAQGGAGGSDGR
jgi:5'(3')-deoxyribonucleotidase